MARTPMYPEGLEQLSLSVPTSIKTALRLVARRQRHSVSQVATVIFEDWLTRRGDLPLQEHGKAATTAPQDGDREGA